MSRPAAGWGRELVSLGNRTHPGPRTSTTVLIDSYSSFPKARWARTILSLAYLDPGCQGRTEALLRPLWPFRLHGCPGSSALALRDTSQRGREAWVEGPRSQHPGNLSHPTPCLTELVPRSLPVCSWPHLVLICSDPAPAGGRCGEGLPPAGAAVSPPPAVRRQPCQPSRWPGLPGTHRGGRR